MLSIIKFEFAHNRCLFIKYGFILLALWLVGIVTPYISGEYIDFLIGNIQLDVFAIFILTMAVVRVLQIVFRYIQSAISTKLNYKIVYQISDK